jgi:ubiquitin carboxyl-terminal hydrolase 48
LDGLDICPKCVADGFKGHEEKTTHVEQVATFDALKGVDDTHCVPADWLRVWRSGKLAAGTLPTEEQFSLYCEHGGPSVNNKQIKNRATITAEQLTLLRSIVGEFDAFEIDAENCPTCSTDTDNYKQDRKAWLAARKVDKNLFKTQLDRFAIFNETNYLLPKTFVDQWEEYLENPGPQPQLKMELCPHGLLDLDPQMDEATYITEPGWEKLCEL